MTARILAAKCGRPLVHLKAERVLSKWYGESTKLMAQVRKKKGSHNSEER